MFANVSSRNLAILRAAGMIVPRKSSWVPTLGDADREVLLYRIRSGEHCVTSRAVIAESLFCWLDLLDGSHLFWYDYTTDVGVLVIVFEPVAPRPYDWRLRCVLLPMC